MEKFKSFVRDFILAIAILVAFIAVSIGFLFLVGWSLNENKKIDKSTFDKMAGNGIVYFADGSSTKGLNYDNAFAVKARCAEAVEAASSEDVDESVIVVDRHGNYHYYYHAASGYYRKRIYSNSANSIFINTPVDIPSYKLSSIGFDEA